MSASPLLIETIRIQNGRVRHIKYHNLRCNSSRSEIFNAKNKLDLRKYIDPTFLDAPEIKCRITYDEAIQKVEYEPYTMRIIKTLKPLEVGKFEYSHKYVDRAMLKNFFQQKGNHDDVLMTKNGYITDTYYANVAALKKGTWYTPQNPLLYGSTRARLLDQNKIIPADIHIDTLSEYSRISIFNAMIPFKRLIVTI